MAQLLLERGSDPRTKVRVSRGDLVMDGLGMMYGGFGVLLAKPTIV